jgi:hypothetical protein
MFPLLVVFVALIAFVTANQPQTVEIKIPFGPVYQDVNYLYSLVAAFSLGMFTWFLVSLFADLRTRAALRQLRRDNERLREELKTLRNLPVSDIEDTGDVADPDDAFSDSAVR